MVLILFNGRGILKNMFFNLRIQQLSCIKDIRRSNDSRETINCIRSIQTTQRYFQDIVKKFEEVFSSWNKKQLDYENKKKTSYFFVCK